MKKGLAKAVTLVTVFIVSFIIFGRFMDQKQLDLTTEMAEATLPSVVLYNEGIQMNELHGYTKQMNAVGMRDTITPLSRDKEILLKIKTYECQIDEVSYEIRSIDSERLISNGKIPFSQEGDGVIVANIPKQSLLEKSEEYILTLELAQGGESCFYYTRIADGQDCHVPESIAFAQRVNELTFSESPDELSAYWEPNVSGDNSTLQKVTINSSLAQANWADFVCDRMTTAIPSVKEMNDSYNVIVLNYVVTANGSGGELEYYNVEEYYRIRYTSERMYLLNFERTMNQIFNGENDFLYENYLQLGIRTEDVEHMQNEDRTVTCFVQEGDLWSYNQDTNRLTEVFSFRGHEGIEARENFMQHDIQILDVDQTGDINYVAYGYMNRGVHEGEVGISFLHYDGLANTNEEKLFIEFDKSYEVLKAELGKLLYENKSGGIYLLFHGAVYRVDLETLEMEKITAGLKDGSYAVSESNRFFAWVSDEASQEISIMDLEKESSQKISAKKKKVLHVLGFLQEDFVYGISSKKKESASAASMEQPPMHALRIVNAQNAKVLKKYRKEGYYIDSVKFNNGVLIINRLSMGENGYTQAQQDSIVNRNQKAGQVESVHTTITEAKQRQVQLVLAEKRPELQPVYVAAKLVMSQKDKTTVFKALEEEQQAYFAYARGKVEVVTTDVAEAIRIADENMGVVVDAKQNYIWKRAKKNLQPVLDVQLSNADESGTPLAKCISTMLKKEGIEVSVGGLLEKGETPLEVLQSLLPGRKVIDIRGCTLEQALYFVNCGTPVLAAGAAQQTVLVVGYDMLNVSLLDPQTNEIVRKTIEEADKQFMASGGTYLVYQ